MKVESGIMDQLESGLPPAIYDTGKNESFMVEMRDGIYLKTRLYLPKGEGPWPVILIRYPYPGMLSFLAAIAAVWSKHGYAAVVQDCRGTGSSEGSWVPFVNEGNDGLDTIEWIKRQSWMNGCMGTYGPSYLSAVQWAMADRVPPEVKAMCICGFTTERYRQNYMNGMFRHDIYTGWAISNSGMKDIPMEGLFKRAIGVKPHIEMDRQLFGIELPWYRLWITSASPEDEYWQSGFWAELREIPKRVHTPILMADGWFDQHLDGMMRDYDKLPEATRRRSRFFLGPWTHAMAPSGDLDYLNHDRVNLLKEALAWFNHHLKGDPYPDPKGDMQTYVIRDGNWRTWNGSIQTNEAKRFYLQRDEETSSLGLDETAPDHKGKATYIYDPSYPVPTKGGAALLRYLGGEADAAEPASVVQEPPGFRDDVISFISEPLREDLGIAGNMKIRLNVSSDAEDTAFSIIVMEVFPDGKAYNIRDGITSLAYRNGASRPVAYQPHETTEIEIECWAITWTIKQGSRLRLDISSSNFPAYHAHSNIAGSWALQKEVRLAEQTLHFGGQYASYLEIPIAD
ncbi:CocE/NonD family hydrolase [Paenibacillus alginolyticus]|uniref:CocE/NonD family hydrolase n=1 Tax=Paenibacillus alginolyticus TaxID=59839 RepID=A0ABT4GAI2_9BACL|nr:CocE/NonD family hydrolase [Paenibacillus alginolyticus]MCY9693173.1 CocE/NonD family hydrolase [Paenibacillus alginolyticus]MEC0144532.1 CocE/NonD family hydrolase [Paenibacillus alginolyticus]